ncbi:MAG TPA: sigma-54 dependent transcriptional regulator [Candidatus Methylomirabilis sp.]|nr:sigma-54 dependent transcriptional regulator [Candidatus Methylomirabilis sp.]
MSDRGSLVYVVDDDASAREGVAGLIRSGGILTKTFASGEEFLAAPRPNMPSCLVLDLNLPGISGLDVQEELVRSGEQLPIIFLTGHGDIPATVRAVKAGATDFLTKPVDDEALLQAIRRCLTAGVEQQTRSGQSRAKDERFDHQQRPKVEERGLEDEIRSEFGFDDIVGGSQALHRVLEQVRVVAPAGSTVLICGETGTGKELLARAVHKLSARNSGPFVKVNCAAIPDSLLESEMFGHEKGAFTGAVAQRIGRFEMAHHGTLFLDEIGEMPLELQPKLLRAIQDLEFERVGGNRTIRTDVRFVVATNRDLKTMVEQKKFRADLYYRLNVFPLNVPPLRERREDIPVLARYFVQKYAQHLGRNINTIPSLVLDALTNYDWPGNIRELQNVLERSVILTTGSVLQVPALEAMGNARPVTLQAAWPPEPRSAERESILKALEQAKGQVGGPDGAAALLGLKRTTLQSRMRKYNISRQFC